MGTVMCKYTSIIIMCIIIVTYNSALHVGMALKKNGGFNQCISSYKPITRLRSSVQLQVSASIFLTCTFATFFSSSILFLLLLHLFSTSFSSSSSPSSISPQDARERQPRPSFLRSLSQRHPMKTSLIATYKTIQEVIDELASTSKEAGRGGEGRGNCAREDEFSS